MECQGRNLWRLALALLLCVTAGCAHPPAVLDVGEFTPVTVQDAQQRDLQGSRVRWGGRIVDVSPRQADTCFEVVSKPLDEIARPRPVDDSFGRFVACRPGFFDPEVYSKGRDVTVVGTIRGIEDGKIGDYDYQFPRLDAEEIYLWPPRPRQVVYANYGYWDPWIWGPYWYRPYWYGPGPRFPHHHHR